MYQLSQITGGIVVFLVTLWFIQTVLPKKYHVIAVFFAFFIETGPLLSLLRTTPIIEWVPGFESQITFERHFGLPHHIWGEIFGLLSVGFLIRSIEKPSAVGALLLFFTTCTAVTILPPYMATIGLTVIPVLTISLLVSKKLIRGLPQIFLFSLTLLLLGLLIKQQLSGAEPWDALTATEKTWWSDMFIYERYLSSILLSIPFLILSILIMVIRGKHVTTLTRQSFLFSFGWVFLPYLYIPLAKYSWFPMANGRLTDGYHYVPVAILVSIGLVEFMSLFSSKYIKRCLYGLILGSILIASGFLTFRYVRWTMTEQNNPWKNQYVPIDNYKAVQFLTTVPKLSGIMATQNSGEIIHAYANVRIYVGGPHGFSDWTTRKWLVNHFYSGRNSNEEASQFLKTNNISYVFFGPEEQSLLQTTQLYPSLLTPVFSSEGTVVYKVL